MQRVEVVIAVEVVIIIVVVVVVVVEVEIAVEAVVIVFSTFLVVIASFKPSDTAYLARSEADVAFVMLCVDTK